MSGYFSNDDYERNRISGSSGYLIFFLPFILCKDSTYGKFCANQGLIGLIAILLIMVAGWIMGLIVGWIPLIGTLVSWIFKLARIIAALAMIYHFYMAVFKNSPKALPYIGNYEFIK